MKEFEKHWRAGGGGICGKGSCEKYWKAALEWVKREAISLDGRGDISREIINRELGSPGKKKLKCDLCSGAGEISIPCGDSFDIARGDTTMVSCPRCIDLNG